MNTVLYICTVHIHVGTMKNYSSIQNCLHLEPSEPFWCLPILVAKNNVAEVLSNQPTYSCSYTFCRCHPYFPQFFNAWLMHTWGMITVLTLCVCVYVKNLLASFQVYTTNRTYHFVSHYISTFLIKILLISIKSSRSWDTAFFTNIL